MNVSVTGALPITDTWHRNHEFVSPYYEATLYSANCTLVLSNMTPDDACFFSLDTHNFSLPAFPPVFKFVDREAANLHRFYEVIPEVYSTQDRFEVVEISAGVLNRHRELLRSQSE